MALAFLPAEHLPAVFQSIQAGELADTLWPSTWTYANVLPTNNSLLQVFHRNNNSLLLVPGLEYAWHGRMGMCFPQTSLTVKDIDNLYDYNLYVLLSGVNVY